MEDKDNIMIEEFLKQAARQQIEDNGFTERVMAQLPDRRIETVRRLSRLWTVFCVVTAGILFFAFGGLQMMKAGVMSMLHMLLTYIEVLAATAPTAEIPVNPWVVLLLLAFVLIYLPYQTARKLSATL